jgi:Flp pilus assembly protein TadD
MGEFQRGEILCPTYGLNYAMAGQIRYLGLRDDAGAAEIRQAYRLAPTHPAVCFIAGRLSAAEGNWEEAKDEFRRAIQLRYPREEVLAVYLDEVHRPDLAAEIFADRWDYLAALARALDKDPAQAQLAEEIRLRSQAALTVEAQKPDAPVQTLAAMADLLQRQGDLPGAVAYYRRALDGNFGNVDWHLGLARILAQLGQTARAVQEADICLRLEPDSTAARRLLSDLAAPPAPLGGGS